MDLLEPVVKHLREAKPQTIERYRGAGGAAGASRHVQALLTKLIVAARVGFQSRFLEQYEEEQRAREHDRRITLEEDRVVLLLAGEGDTLEVKGSLSLDIDRLLRGDGAEAKSQQVTDEVLSAIVGFLNGKQKRSRLVVGAVEAERYGQANMEEKLGRCPQIGEYAIVGIEKDYRYRDWDRYELQIRDLVKDHISPNVEGSLDVKRVQVGDRTLAVIELERDPVRWCYLDDKHFCVRLGNRTRVLTGREADEYKKEWEGKTI